MGKLLTVVIPAYNMQDYLVNCLNSLIIPESDMLSLEVLIINDGSKDATSSIAHSFEDNYPGVFKAIDKANGNYGSCINRALLEATGKYIKVLDADDWFESSEFSAYVKYLAGLDDVDLVLTDFQIVGVDGLLLESRSYCTLPKYECFNFQECAEVRAVFDMHTFTYRTGFLKEIGYRQTEGISYTDVEWVYIPMAFIKSCIYAPFNVYRYLMGRNGQTMNSRAIAMAVNNHMAVAYRLVNYYDSLDNVSRNTQERIDNEVDYLSRVIYKSCLVEQDRKDFDRKALKEYDLFLSTHRAEIFRSLERRLKPNGMPLHYVRFWHIAGFRFPLSFMRDLVRQLRYKA